MYALAEAEARTAIESDAELAEAHLSLAQVRMFYYWDYAGARAGIERSLALNPNVSSTHHFYGALLTATGELDRALVERKRAFELDPTSAFATTAVGWVHFFARRHDEAIRWYRKALELDPHFASAHSALAEALHALGRHDEAVDEELALRAMLGSGGIEPLRAAFRDGGIEGYRRKRLELLADEAASKDPSSIAWSRARLSAELGDADQAFRQLDIALDERAGLAPFLAVVPAFDGLRDDPRFAERLRRVGLAVPAR
jgi:tetratricopeptide (TPR) repeat protein